MKVEIYSDVACPWCYIGKRRFERALAAFPGAERVEVVFRPYQLDPGAASDGAPLLDALAKKFGAQAPAMAGRVTEQARAEGIAMDFSRAVSANTLHAHRLMWLAESEHGPEVQRALAERLFEAHFARGGDVGDVEVLAGLAAEAGIDRERARGFLDSTGGLREVRAAIDGARQLGISAVPTFVFEGKYAVQGAQPTSAFLQALETVAAEEGAGAAAGPGGDGCDDGSCAV